MSMCVCVCVSVRLCVFLFPGGLPGDRCPFEGHLSPLSPEGCVRAAEGRETGKDKREMESECVCVCSACVCCVFCVFEFCVRRVGL